MKHRKTLFQLTWPTYIEFSFLMLMMISDTVMLSQYSDASVAAVGNANRIVFLLTVIINIVAIGVGVVVSQYIGAKKDADSQKALFAGLVGGLLTSIVMAILLQISANVLLGWINTPALIYNDALSYLRIVGMGIVFVSLSQTSGAGFRSFGFPKRVMIAGALGNILNIILNFFLIFGLWGFPELGVTGAAIATLTSRIFTAGLLFVNLLKEKIIAIRMTFNELIYYLKDIFKIGFPSALEQFLYQVSEFFILIMVNSIGTLAVTTQVYVFNLTLPVLVFAVALSQGNQVIVGWHIGAYEDKEAYHRTVRSMLIGIVTVVIISTTMYLNAQWILRIFTTNPEIIETGKNVLLVFIFLEIGRLSNILVIQALRATGDVKYPVYAALISMFGIKVPLAYYLVFIQDIGLIGIFIAIAADEIARGLFVFIRWTKRPWLKKERIVSKPI
jgi:putative MATE family efflux protein